MCSIVKPFKERRSREISQLRRGNDWEKKIKEIFIRCFDGNTDYKGRPFPNNVESKRISNFLRIKREKRRAGKNPEVGIKKKRKRS